MLPLITHRDRLIESVCTSDPSVSVPERTGAWVRRDTVTASDEALVAHWRVLSHADLVECIALEGWQRRCLEASSRGVEKLAGPGLPSDRVAALEALPPAARLLLGAHILEASQLSPDPTEPAGS